MVSQLRTYTVNRGMMDSLAEGVRRGDTPDSRQDRDAHIRHLGQRRPKRVHLDSQLQQRRRIPEKEAAYFASEERKALGDRPTSHLAKIEVKVIESVLQPAGVA